MKILYMTIILFLLAGCKEVGDYARRYKYGPYYKENQEIYRQQALARIEAENARSEYWQNVNKSEEAELRMIMHDLENIEWELYDMNQRQADGYNPY